MQREPASRIVSVLRWLIPVLLLAVLDPPVLRVVSWVFFEMMVPAAILAGAAVCVSRLAASAETRSLKDEFSEEEGARRQRLSSLGVRAEQMEVTLRDLRALKLPPADATRAQWAEIDLEEALKLTRSEMDRERAGLLLLDATRWLTQVEPLLREMDDLDEDGIAQWLNRLGVIRSQGLTLMSRVHEDPGAVTTQPGDAAARLLEEALSELEALRADLLTRRAELLARGPEAPIRRHDQDPTLARLRGILHRARAQREVRSWLREDEERGE